MITYMLQIQSYIYHIIYMVSVTRDLNIDFRSKSKKYIFICTS